jgi:zinc and cadmium transporter
MTFYFIFLFIITLGAGLLPFFFKQLTEKHLQLLLAFSGSFLLGITLLHLLPESFQEIGSQAGGFIFVGFFLQFLIQRLTHGVEHGHLHCHDGHTHSKSLWAILLGLSIHAFLEGLPLGFEYNNAHTTSTVFFGVAAHKIPEAFTLGSLLLLSANRSKWLWVFVFAAISPVAGLLANYFGHTMNYVFVEDAVAFLIPVVIGAFIHISTTILFESGTKHHDMSGKKVAAIILGIVLAGLTLLLHVH